MKLVIPKIKVMQKYYILEWPECQEFMGQKGCYPVMSDDGSPATAVPCELYDNEKE